jgi:DNA-directed RNA polymerase specialized sigma24 family protein
MTDAVKTHEKGARMGTRVRQTETLFAPPPEQLHAAREVMIDALVGRDLPLRDAEDAASHALTTMARSPEKFASKLAAVDDHVPYFVNLALKAYLAQMQAERHARRRAGLAYRVGGRADPGWASDSLTAADVLALAEFAPLTALQRQYLRAIFVDQLTVQQIATATRRSTQVVSEVLQRAAAVVDEYRTRMLTS